MKKLNKILSLVMVIAMVMSLCAAFVITASAVEVGSVFAPKNLGENVATDGYFYIAGVDPDGTKYNVTYDAGNKQFNANGKRVFLAKSIEKASVYPHSANTDYLTFYARPNDGYKAAIIFKAPVAGTYSIDMLLCKPYHQYGGAGADTGSLNTVTILKNGEGTALYNETSVPVTDPTTNLPQQVVNQDFAYTGTVDLQADEEIWFLMSSDANYSNMLNIIRLNVTYTASIPEVIEVGDVFAPKNLGEDIASDAHFYIAGVDPDGVKHSVTYDAANKQFNANGKRVFLAKSIEKGAAYPHADNTDYLTFYARPNDGYKAAIIFKAPVAGTYNLDVLLCKPYHQYGGAGADTGCLNTVTILKNGTGTALYTKTSEPVTDPSTHLPQQIVYQDFAYTGSVELAEGDEIWITMGADANYSNMINIIRCNVTLSALYTPPTPPTPSTPSAPSTADGIMLSVMVAVAVAGVAVVASKKRR